jgi:hypothetical protein
MVVRLKHAVFVIARVACTAVGDITNYLEVPAGYGDVLKQNRLAII